MIVLLPPSETKRPGGGGAALRLDELGYPALRRLRAELVDDVVGLAADRDASRRALGLTAAQDAEIDRNAMLLESATMPALDRYSGVLYDALDPASLTGARAARARARLVVCSALFGLLRADDAVPAYRLSATSKLPGQASLAARWRPVLEPVLADLARTEAGVDLRSGPYAALGRLPGAIGVDVLAEHADGHRAALSHFNKAHKGRLARALATSRAEPSDAAGVAAVARRAGFRIERRGRGIAVLIDA